MSNAETIASIVAISKKIGQSEEFQKWMDQLMKELDGAGPSEQALLARLTYWATTRAAKESGE